MNPAEYWRRWWSERFPSFVRSPRKPREARHASRPGKPAPEEAVSSTPPPELECELGPGNAVRCSRPRWLELEIAAVEA